jgi:N-acetylglutamate synthase-like GNAT family acetyltransferase
VEFLLILLVLVVAVAIVYSPLREARRRSPGSLAAEAERAALEAAKETKYREIRDAELDHRTGKLSEADWRELDATLRAEAVELLSRIDALDAVAVRTVPADAEAARELLAELGPPGADPAELGPPGGRFLVAYRAGEAVGCAGLRRADAHTGEIAALYVTPSARGQGIGRRLLEEVQTAAREGGFERLRLDATPRAPEALALLRAAGFEAGDRDGLEKRLGGGPEPG